METVDRNTLTRLIFGYKHLWLKYQETRYLAKHPGSDPDAVHQGLC